MVIGKLHWRGISKHKIERKYSSLDFLKYFFVDSLCKVLHINYCVCCGGGFNPFSGVDLGHDSWYTLASLAWATV